MLEAIEASGFAAFFRTSFVLYPLVNALHVLAIGALVTSAALMDLRILGLGRGIGAGTVIRSLRPVAAGALALAVLSGLTLFAVQPTDYFGNPAFRLKMVALLLAVLNAAVFASFRAHRDAAPASAKIMALASIVLWLTVAICGRFIGFLA